MNAERDSPHAVAAARPHGRAVLRGALLLAAYVAIALLPVALAWLQDLPRRPFNQDLSSGLAMAAFAMLLMEFLLAGRGRMLSRRIGMDITMRVHQFAGMAALALLALHPLLYGPMYSELQPWDALRNRSVVLTNAAMVSGVLGLMLLAALAFVAALRSRIGWTYETWRLAHVIGAVAVAGMGLHHTLATGRYAQDPASIAFWVAAAALAAAAMLKVYALDPLLAYLRRYRVVGVEREAERTWRMRLEPVAGRTLRFIGGQFVWLKLGRAFARITEHPFSIASGPAADGRIDLLIKEAGDFTRTVGALAPGTAAFLDGPYGNFTLEGRSGEGVMLIAGGIGIAPMLSILHDMAGQGERRPVRLVYANRRAAQIAAQPELDALGRRLRLEVLQVLGEPPADWPGMRGRLEGDTLAACLPKEGRERWLYFVCGPVEMIDAVELALERQGIPLGQIVSERFRYDGGVLTPRERLIRRVALAALGAIGLGVLLFALAR